MPSRLRRAPRRTARWVRARAEAVAAHRGRRGRVVTEDVAAWGRAHDLEVVPLSPAETHERRPPIALAGGPAPNFADPVRTHNNVHERVLVCLPGARLWGDNGLVILPDGSFSSESVYSRWRLESLPEFSTPRDARIDRLPGDGFPVLGPFANRGNYFHWIHDGLLRLHGTDGALPPSVRFLVPANVRGWQLDLLALLGIGRDRIDAVPHGRGLECERLWFASLPPKSSTLPAAARWLRDRLWAGAGIDAPDPRRRLYLARAGTGHARVVNEAELAPILDRHGFETVHPERLSIRDQIHLFATAGAVVSGTSSGLTNLLFAAPTTRTLEILEPGWAAHSAYIVWQFTEALGQQHWYCTGESVPNPTHPGRADVRVDPTVFAEALGHWLDAPEPPVGEQHTACG